MESDQPFDVLIIGGSYAGLSAAMTLGRSMRKVLVIDSGAPCNKPTPRSHNFLTHDGRPPADVAAEAKAQVLAYDTVTFLDGLVTGATDTGNGFVVEVAAGQQFGAKKLLFATGVKDLLPDLEGFADCWGITVLHCPYCHGYEVRDQPTGLLANGDLGFELSRLIHHWTKQLTLYTNGSSTLSAEQSDKIKAHGIRVVETGIRRLQHANGHLECIELEDGTEEAVQAIYTRPALQQHCDLPVRLGCYLTEQGYIHVDEFQRTSRPGIFAAGDNTTMFRTLSGAIAAGTKAGALINKELVDEQFEEAGYI